MIDLIHDFLTAFEQVSYVAFTLAGRECPVRNLLKSPKPDLEKLPRITEIVTNSSSVTPLAAAVVISSEAAETSPQPKVKALYIRCISLCIYLINECVCAESLINTCLTMPENSVQL